MTRANFKTCPHCQKSWANRDDFLHDKELIFVGYQPDFGILEQGLFYFTHEALECGTTIALEANQFLSLYSGKKYKGSRYQSEDCAHYCLDKKRLQRCKAHCENAFVREVTQLITDRFSL